MPIVGYSGSWCSMSHGARWASFTRLWLEVTAWGTMTVPMTTQPPHYFASRHTGQTKQVQILWHKIRKISYICQRNNLMFCFCTFLDTTWISSWNRIVCTECLASVSDHIECTMSVACLHVLLCAILVVVWVFLQLLVLNLLAANILVHIVKFGVLDAWSLSVETTRS